MTHQGGCPMKKVCRLLCFTAMLLVAVAVPLAEHDRVDGVVQSELLLRVFLDQRGCGDCFYSRGRSRELLVSLRKFPSIAVVSPRSFGSGHRRLGILGMARVSLWSLPTVRDDA